MKVLIAILSCHGYQLRRYVQRTTWLEDLREGGGVSVDFRFFLGQAAEIESGGSRVIWLNCSDAYSGLSEKVSEVAQWALDQRYDFLFKCDDDTYVRPGRLLASGFQQHDYFGFIEDRDCHLRAFNFPVYPHAAGGPGYWLSRKAMAIVAKGLPAQSAEDFAVGEALALAGIPAAHDARYVHDDRTDRSDVLRSNFISLHKCSPAEMRRVHAELKSFCPIGAE